MRRKLGLDAIDFGSARERGKPHQCGAVFERDRSIAHARLVRVVAARLDDGRLHAEVLECLAEHVVLLERAGVNRSRLSYQCRGILNRRRGAH